MKRCGQRITRFESSKKFKIENFKRVFHTKKINTNCSIDISHKFYIVS